MPLYSQVRYSAVWSGEVVKSFRYLNIVSQSSATRRVAKLGAGRVNFFLLINSAMRGLATCCLVPFGLVQSGAVRLQNLPANHLVPSGQVTYGLP